MVDSKSNPLKGTQRSSRSFVRIQKRSCEGAGGEPHQKKEDWTRPMVALSQLNCLLMGKMAMLMFTRSMLHSMNATKQRPTMLNLLLHLDVDTTSTTCTCMPIWILHRWQCWISGRLVGSDAQQHNCLPARKACRQYYGNYLNHQKALARPLTSFVEAK